MAKEGGWPGQQQMKVGGRLIDRAQGPAGQIKNNDHVYYPGPEGHVKKLPRLLPS